MPYQTLRESRYIHAKAAEGVPWAQKFVADSHGTHVMQQAIKRHRHKRRKHAHR